MVLNTALPSWGQHCGKLSFTPSFLPRHPHPHLPGLELTPSLRLGRLLRGARPTGQACRKGVSGTASGRLSAFHTRFPTTTGHLGPDTLPSPAGQSLAAASEDPAQFMHRPALGLRPHWIRCRMTTGVIDTNTCNCPHMFSGFWEHLMYFSPQRRRVLLGALNLHLRKGPERWRDAPKTTQLGRGRAELQPLGASQVLLPTDRDLPASGPAIPPGWGLTKSVQNSTHQEDFVGKVNQHETEPESAGPAPHPSWVLWWLCFPRMT